MIPKPKNLNHHQILLLVLKIYSDDLLNELADDKVLFSKKLVTNFQIKYTT